MAKTRRRGITKTMHVKNFHNQIPEFYRRLYVSNSIRHKTIPNVLRPEDEWPAVCYAHDIFAIGYTHDVLSPEYVRGTPRNLQKQCQHLLAHGQRKPQHVLEIGSGHGQISCALSHMGYRVTTIDVNDQSEKLHKTFSHKHFACETGNAHTLLIGDLDLAQIHLDLANIDTIIMVQSIEHIFAAEWWRFFDFMLPHMKRNHTQLVITNLLYYWPLGLPGDCEDHVSLINDDFYNQLQAECQQVLHRKTSHIALRY